MISVKVIEALLFGLLSIFGIFGIHYSIVVIRALVKHRKDKAPLTSYFLNSEQARVPYFIYAGIFGFFTGLMLLLGYIDMGFTPVNVLQYIIFFSGILFAIFTSVFIVFEIRFWYIKFKRFV